MIVLYFFIIKYQIKSMINIRRVILSCLFVVAILGLRQSDTGSNDWSRENIGKLIEIKFPSFNGSSE